MTEIIKTFLKLIIGRGVKKSYSQNGEDVLIDNLIGSKKDGFYVDVGAFHPVQYSNTYLLYKKGWRGLAIDPNQRARNLFGIVRPRDKFVCAGVGLSNGTSTYFEFEDPAYNTMSDVQMKEWKSRGIKLRHSSSVKMRSLSAILDEYRVDTIDVLTIDVEGFEISVLESYDWNIPVGLIVIEDHEFDVDMPKKSAVYTFLISKGYHLCGIARFSLIFKK